jgi:hypothetical protein
MAVICVTENDSPRRRPSARLRAGFGHGEMDIKNSVSSVPLSKISRAQGSALYQGPASEAAEKAPCEGSARTKVRAEGQE